MKVGSVLFFAGLGLTSFSATRAQSPTGALEMERAPRAHERTIGRLNGWNINVAPGTSLLGLKASGKEYMVISYGEGSELARRLTEDTRTVVMQEDASLLGRGLAVLAIDELSDIDEYADLTEEGPSAVCGAFQLLNLDAPVVAELVLQDPIFDPATRLAPVAQAVTNAKTDLYTTHQSALVALGSRCHSGSGSAAATAKVQELFQTAGANIPGFTVTQVTHTQTNQKSVVATIPGKSDQTSTVVLGGHLDSIVGANCAGNAPGADDDASGIAAITEVIRTINTLGLEFQRTIEFHGYAAEEVGLVGSGQIARSYRNAGRRIISQMQWDMVGYGTDDTITLITSNTSATLNRYVKDLAYQYVNGNAQNVVEAPIPGSASSDHASWTQQGFPAVFPFEKMPINGNIHSTRDTLDQTTNTALASRMIKLGVAYLSHMAGLVDPSLPSGGGPPTAGSNDLKVAITPATISGTYHVAIAGAGLFQSVELCKVPAGSLYCSTDIRILPYIGAKGGRYFYMQSDDTITMAAGESWRAHAYDASNQLVARRDFTITAK